MSNLIKGEFYKLRKSKCFIGMILLAICAGFLLIVEWDNEGIRMFGGANVTNLITFSMVMIIFCSFIFAILSVVFIVNDFNNGGISKSFSYGFRRSDVILSKLAVCMLFSLVLILIYTTILVMYVSYNYGLSDVLNFGSILHLMRIISIGVMYNLATISIILMTAIVTKSNFFTFVSSIIILITFIIGMNSYPYISDLSFFLPYCTGRAATDMLANNVDIVISIISSVITFIITIGGSLLYVKHKDIK